MRVGNSELARQIYSEQFDGAENEQVMSARQPSPPPPPSPQSYAVDLLVLQTGLCLGDVMRHASCSLSPDAWGAKGW